MEIRTLLGGIAIGAAGTLMLDPNRGARRRALLRDQAMRASRLTGEVLDTALHDASNRARGLLADTHGWIPEEDARLLARVRARLSRAGTHPKAIAVEVQNGRVTLRGPVLAHEVRQLLSAAAAVRGVDAVINELDPHETANGVPALQHSVLGGGGFDLLQRAWGPAAGAMVGALALAAGGLAYAYAKR
jgi:hypothetical protein